MADDSVGGIQAEVTANAGPFLAELQKAEAAAKAFDAKYGKINVTITATLAMPSQAQIQAYQRELAQKIGAAPPAARPQPTTAAQPAVAAAPTTPARQAAAPATIQRPAAPITAAAEPAAAPIINEALNRENAISRGKPGQRVQFQGADGNIKTAVVPSGGGAIGSGTSFAQAGLPRGPQEFAGGARGGDPNFAFQQMQEQAGKAARLEAELAALQAQMGAGAKRNVEESLAAQRRAGLSQAQIEQRRAAGRASYERALTEGRVDPVTGRISSEQVGTVIITRAAQREQVRREQGPLPPRQAPQVEAAAEPILYTPPPGTTQSEQEELLAALMGERGPERQREAQAQVDRSAPPTRRSRARPQATSQRRTFQQKLSPQQRAGAQAALEEQAAFPEAAEEDPRSQLSVRDLRGVIEDSESRLIRAQARTQNRALGTTFGGIITSILGGTQARDAILEANRAIVEARGFQRQLNEAKAVELDIVKQLGEEEDPAKRKTIQEDLTKQRATVEELSEKYADAAANAEDLSLAADRAAKGGLRNISGAFAGAVVGSLAFGAGMSAITALFPVAEKAISPFIARLTGYVELTNKITGALSDQAREQHGLTGIVVAASFAQAGLGTQAANTIRPLLEQRVAIEAGTKAYQAQIELIRTGVQIQEQLIRSRAGLAPGPGQAPGAIPGITAGIGGLFGTPIGQTPGLIEQLAGTTPRAEQRSSGIIASLIGGGIGAVLGTLVAPGVGTVGGGVLGAAIGAETAVPGSAAAGFFQDPRLKEPAFRQQQAAAEAEVAAQKLSVLELAVTDLNEASERGALGAQNLASATTGATDAQIKATAEILGAMGATEEQVRDLAESGFALKGLTGTFEQRLQQATDFFEAAGRGAAITPIAEATRQLRDLTIPARLFQLTAQGRLERDFAQIQAGVQRAAQPFLPLGTTVPGGLGGVSSGLQPFISQAQGLDQINVDRIAAARVQIANLALPGDRAGATQAFDRLQGLGQQTAGLQTFITQSQVNLATAQYNEQLRQARLSLADLAALTGNVGDVQASNLGIAQKQVIEIERQNQKLQIQLSTLQLELQQRQINFQRAIAGFTAPGLTPAERAARREEAEIEADFAQQQLDLQKEILANQAKAVPLQIQIQDIQFQRDYITALNAINLLTRGRQVTIDVAAAQEALQRVNAEIEVTSAEFQTYIQGAHQAATAAISDIAGLLAVYGPKAIEFFDAVGGAYQDSFTDYMTHIIAQIQRGLNAINSAVPHYFTGPGSGTHASGSYGTYSTPTTMTVGEAGTETVAVIRNPREMLWSGGGGTQINLTVTVTGNTVRSDEDIDMLTAKVTRGVEEALGRRASAFGFGAAR